MKQNYPKIKICGLKNISEVICASDYGAFWFGMIFVKNTPRSISLRKAEILINKAPKSLKPVAVTIHPSLKEVKQLVDIGIKDIQLHGNENIEQCKILNRDFKMNTIKAINLRNLDGLRLAEYYSSNVNWVLFDYKDKFNLGGTGKSFDWNILKNKNLKYNWILSGGLDYNNMREAIKITGAKALDVSSGVEIKKGTKSIKLIKQFCSSARDLY